MDYTSGWRESYRTRANHTIRVNGKLFPVHQDTMALHFEAWETLTSSGTTVDISHVAEGCHAAAERGLLRILCPIYILSLNGSNPDDGDSLDVLLFAVKILEYLGGHAVMEREHMHWLRKEYKTWKEDASQVRSTAVGVILE